MAVPAMEANYETMELDVHSLNIFEWESQYEEDVISLVLLTSFVCILFDPSLFLLVLSRVVGRPFQIRLMKVMDMKMTKVQLMMKMELILTKRQRETRNSRQMNMKM